MEEQPYKILIVDERQDDIDEFKNTFELAKDFEVFGLDHIENDEELFHFIRENEIDAVAFDYKLKELHSSFTKNGDGYFNELLETFENFPTFILTNNVADAKAHQIDPFKIIDKEIISVDKDDEEQVNKAESLIENIRYLINNYRTTLQTKEDELAVLIAKQESGKHLTELEIQKMVELDDYLENSISKKLRVPSNWKSPTGLETLSNFLHKTEEVLEELKKINDCND